MLGGISYAGIHSLRPDAPMSVAPISGTTPPVTTLSPPEGKASETSMPPPTESPGPKEVVVAMAGAVKIPGLLHLSSDARVGDAIKRAGGAKPDADLDEINLAAKLSDGDQIYVPHRKTGRSEEKIADSERSPRATRTARIAPRYRGGELLPHYAPLPPLTPPPLGGTPPAKEGSSPYRDLPVSTELPPQTEAPPRSEPPSFGGPSSRDDLPSFDSPPPRPSSRGTRGHGGAKARPAGLVSLNTASEADLETLPGIGPATAQKILAYRREHGGFRSIDEITAIRGIGPKKLETMRPYLRL